MNIARIIQLDLAARGAARQIGEAAVAGDSGSRSLVFELMQEGVPWSVPEGVRAALAFRTAGGFSGEYDTMPDGTDAFAVEGNRITIRLIDQVMAEPGLVTMALILRDERLGRISAFPVMMTVTEGIVGARELPKEYYLVRTLQELNERLAAMDAQFKQMDPEAVMIAAQEAKAAAEAAQEAAQSVDAQRIAQAIAQKADDLYMEARHLFLLSEGSILGDGVELPEGGGLSFDSGYVDEENRLHLTLGGADIEGFEPFPLPAGGGGAASVMKLSTTLIERTFTVMEHETACRIPFTWSSILDGEPTGAGFLEWMVNGSRVAQAAVEQGSGYFDVRPFLAAGAENAVVLRVTDAYGSFRTLAFTITVAGYGLSWNLGETAVYGRMGVSVRLTPTGSGEKVLKAAVDGEVISETTVTTTGRTTTVTVPVQNHGAHVITAWVEATVEGELLKTEPLRHVGVWLSTNVVTPVIGVLTPQIEVGQYGTASVRWFVVDPTAETATVELKVDGVTVNVLENVGRETQLWAYRANEQGSHELTIHCGKAVGRAAVTVTDLGYDIHPVTAGLELDLDPAGHSNSESGRANFGYLDGEGVNHPLTFSENFDWVSGGFQQDSDGVTAFVVKRGTYVTLDRSLLDADCHGTGKSLKVIFKSENVRNYDAELMSCKSGNVGITVQAQTATVSSQLETMRVLYCEGRRIELNLNVESENENALAWIDLKGIQSCPPIRYGATDSWGQSSPVPMTIGSEDADVWLYRLKLWGNSQNLYERIDDYIASAGTTAEMVERFERSDIYNTDGSISLSKLAKASPKLRVIHLKAGRMTTGKEDEVTADFEMTYGDGGESHHLTAQGVTFKAQGTSSLEYILAALNLDVDFSTASSFTNGLGETLTGYAMTDSSVPVSYFNLKANVASSESSNNVCLADEYNTFNPYICAPKLADSRVRDTVEGHPCAVFFTSTADVPIEVGARTVLPGETILYFVGDMNNSKKNFAVFGQDNSKWPKQCCVEVMNNTELPCRFKENIGDDETWKDGNFEFRFPKAPTDEMKAAFRAMQRWVVSTDRDAATGAAFDVPVTYGGVVYAGDTPEYRAAKFKAEFADYFVPEAMDFHYLFTDQHCMTDNRAKNLFFCYEYVAELDDYRWSVRCDYDNDTALGNDNSGGLTFSYGLEDTDMAGDSWVFNAHDSCFWCNIRDLRAEELRSLHIRLAGQGAWDAERLSRKFREYQSAVPEALRAEDMHNKYFMPWLLKDAAAYAAKCLGTKEEQREQFFPYQQVYKGSQYADVSNRSDAISMRVTVEKAENGNLTITTYSDMYLVVMYGNGGRVMKRVKRNTPTLIECPTDSLGDTETYIFMASNLTAISSLAGLKPKFVLATTARRLQELIVGTGEVGYVNLNLSQIGVGGNQMLRLLDLRGTPNLVTALDLSQLTSLERFLANGSGITGVTFARGCPLTEVRLPAVSSLVALELRKLESFLMDSSGLTLVRVEGCPGIDTLGICKNAPNLERGRLTEVDWSDTDAAVLMRLTALAGYDAQGKPTDRFVLTGKAHAAKISQLQIDAITAAFPELTLSYDEIVPSVTVTFCNYDGSVLKLKDGSDAVFTVASGGSVANPVTSGLMDEPVKPSDVEHHYSNIGWDKSLEGITADTVITAKYSAADRYYRVTYWLDTAESKMLQEDMVIAHGRADYAGIEPELDGQLWMGWDAVTGDVVRDMDVHAVFIVPELPDSVPEEYDFLYSDDPTDDSAFTLAEFAGIVELGAAKTYFRVGDRIRIVPDTEVFADSSIVLSVHGFNHYRLADGSGEFAGVVFGMVGVMNANHRMNSGSTNVGGWPAMELRNFLNETIFPELPIQWKKLIREVEVLSSEGGTKAGIVTSEDRLFLLSAAEVGIDAAVVPYCSEVAEGADEIAFSCYTDNASRIKKTYNGTGTATDYWLRSPLASSDTNNRCVLGRGVSHQYLTELGIGVSFAFCMGGASK